MKRIIIFLAAIFNLFVLLNLVNPQEVFADTVTCNLGNQGFNATTGNLQFCVGGFSSKDSLRTYSVRASCIKAKGAVTCNAQPQSLSLANVADSAILQDSNGAYYTCQSVTMNSSVEQAQVDILSSGGSSVCTIAGTTGIGNQFVDVTTGNSDIQCGNGSGINTAIGCIPISDQNALIGFILRWGIGIGGGIAFLLILAAGFQIMTSRGDPNRLKAGQELMTSAIAGLLLLIFSLVILRIIGFDILKITFFS